MTQSVKKLALVTGANKGIGLAIARQLVDQSFHVLLGTRSLQNGKEALEKNFKKDDTIECLQIDLNSEESIKKAAELVAKKYSAINTIVHNAATAYKNDEFNTTVVKNTIAVNYYGTIAVNNAFMPLLSTNDPRIIFLASRAGRLGTITSKTLQEQFLKCDDFTELDNLLNQFVVAVEKDINKLDPWPRSAYVVSKIGVAMYSRILATKPQCKNKFVAAMCPGFVSTDMTSHKGPRTPEQGAWAATQLATMPLNRNTPSGVFWATFYDHQIKKKEDKHRWKEFAQLKIIEWTNPKWAH